MIFVIVGSQKFQFDRLLKCLDEQIAERKIQDEVFAQIGCSTYKPRFYESKDYLDRELFDEKVRTADIIVTHGGTGAIVGSLKKGRKVIAVPRLERYGEHVDDHQLQIIEQFGSLGFLCACYEPEKLWESIIEAEKTEYRPYKSNTEVFLAKLRTNLEKL